MNITKPSLQRIARQAGIKSMSDDCVDIIRTLLHAKTAEICDILILQNNCTKTIMVDDVYAALQSLNVNLTRSDNLGQRVYQLK